MVWAESKQRTIVRNSSILHSEPTVEGTRIPVRAIVLFKHEYGDITGIQNALPSLSLGDIETAMRFYREHRDEINRYIAENNEGEDIPYDEL